MKRFSRVIIIATVSGLSIAGFDVGSLANNTASAYARSIDPPLGANAMSTPPIPPDASPDHLLSRPLFSATRRPPFVATVTSKPGTPRLTGILLSGNQKHAIFAIPDQDAPIIALPGDKVADWRIVSIGNLSVMVMTTSGARLLGLNFGLGDGTVATGVLPPPTPLQQSFRQLLATPPTPVAVHSPPSPILGPPMPPVSLPRRGVLMRPAHVR